jgi:hypothetical protein
MVELEHPKDLMHLLRECVEVQASSLMIKPGLPPVIRVQGQLKPTRYARVTPEETLALCKPVVADEVWAQLEEQGEVEFEYVLGNEGGFVVNLFRSLGQVSVVANSTVIARPAPPPMEDLKAAPSIACHPPAIKTLPEDEPGDQGEADAGWPTLALPVGPQRSGSAAKLPPTHPRADEDMNRW